MNNDLYSVSLPTTDHNHVVFNGVSSYMIPSNTHEQLMARNPFPSAVQEEIGNPFPDIYSGQANLGTPLPAPTMPKPFGQSLFNIDNPSAFNSFGPPRHDEFLQVMSTVHPSYHIIESTYPGWNLNNCNNLLPRNELSLSLGSCSEKSSVVTQVTSRDTEELTLYCGPSGSVHFPHVSGSRYFGLSEQILAEVASYALGNFDEVDFNKGLFVVDSDEFPSTSGEIKSQEEIQNLVLEKNPEKTELLKMLQMVNHRCSQYLDRIQNVVALFHSATNSGSPQRLARFATNTLLSAFRNMRERITRQLLISGQERGRGSMRGKAKAFESSFIQKQGALQELGRKDQQSWRPQRGLPERSVSVLRAWMFQNFLHPYPKDNDKHLLALQSGLTRNQVSNWFINARVRLWKPMIEEMYSESKKHQTEEGSEGDFRSHGNISIQRPE